MPSARREVRVEVEGDGEVVGRAMISSIGVWELLGWIWCWMGFVVSVVEVVCGVFRDVKM